MPKFSQTSINKLITCDERLQVICNEAIEIVDFVVLEGHRGQKAQNEAVAKGTSKLLWPHGKHNSMPSKAIDIAPYLPEVKIDWKDMIAFGRLMGVIQAIAHKHGFKVRFGLDWDGDFRSVDRDPDEDFLDAPHVEIID
jgi:peptidoglycan L-alanyl-D-glutamate endopeptidase CwlK